MIASDDPQGYLRKHGLFDLIETAWRGEAASEEVPLRPNYDDLARIHELVLHRRAMTILEFGSGFSTMVAAHALALNEAAWEALPSKPAVRNSHLWQLVTVDTSEAWMGRALARLPSPLRARVHPHVSDARIGHFQGQLCHFFDTLPDVVADFVYLDGPDPEQVLGSSNGLTFTCAERTVMAGDLLRMESTFLPGTFILVDGRTNNARFLERNFTRRYEVCWDPEADVTTFELVEPRLGPHNVQGTDLLPPP